jgi:hypothetical protein
MPTDEGNAWDVNAVTDGHHVWFVCPDQECAWIQFPRLLWRRTYLPICRQCSAVTTHKCFNRFLVVRDTCRLG